MIHIKVVTPRGTYLESDVDSVHMKTVVGEITLLPNHTPLFAALVPCQLDLKQEDPYALAGGFTKFEKDRCLILTDAIEGRKDIDIERARQAAKRAQDRLDKKDPKTNMHRAQLALARAINRISVYGG